MPQVKSHKGKTLFKNKKLKKEKEWEIQLEKAEELLNGSDEKESKKEVNKVKAKKKKIQQAKEKIKRQRKTLIQRGNLNFGIESNRAQIKKRKKR